MDLAHPLKLLYLIVAVASSATTIYVLFLFCKRRGFQPVRGTIAAAKIQRHETENDEVKYSVHVTMRYEVEGRAYEEAARFTTLARLQLPWDPAEFARTFKAGQKRTIYYDPNNPETYVFSIPVRVKEWMFVVATLIWSVTFALCFLYGKS